MVSIRKVHDERGRPFERWLSMVALPERVKTKLGQMLEQLHAHRAKLDSDNDAPKDELDSALGQEMVEILQQLQMDDETLQAALVFPYCEANALSEAQMTELFGEGIGKLIAGARRMDAIRTLYLPQQIKGKGKHPEQQVDKIRRMLLSMVEDVRAVVLKLSERICHLRQVKRANEETRVLVARECAAVYAPLANRLGIGQLKWELEDLSFRYLHPNSYKKIADMLREKRADRERYIDDFVTFLQARLDEAGVNAKVYGRPKHIYSIYKKMQKKHLSFEQLFDIRAVRIITDELKDCYGALGTVHANFKHIPKEFDDYVATPKANGYQSIHTVVLGPEGKTMEIQIRTQQMHDDAELGVAAHWKYKEGGQKASGFDDKINWLRKILQWQEEVSDGSELVEELRSQVFDDRVYVFTPKGDVIDLPKGATPLDFAYYIHTNVGHRCIGAKVGGRIVPFTYVLKTGDQVELLTGKALNPSRDWMNPNLGYVFSSRARAKIHTYFRKQDKAKNTQAGKELLDTELHRLHIPVKEAADALEHFGLHQLDELYAAVGAGDVRLMQVVNFLQRRHAPTEAFDPRLKQKSAIKPGRSSVEVEGVGNLMSSLARCCRPLPGDEIIGFITQGKGVSVHRSDCDQLANLLNQHPERHIDVHWSGGLSGHFKADMEIGCHDRDGLLKDITTELANEKVTLLGVNTRHEKKTGLTRITLNTEVKNLASLSRTLGRLQRLKGVVSVDRRQL